MTAAEKIDLRMQALEDVFARREQGGEVTDALINSRWRNLVEVLEHSGGRASLDADQKLRYRRLERRMEGGS